MSSVANIVDLTPAVPPSNWGSAILYPEVSPQMDKVSNDLFIAQAKIQELTLELARWEAVGRNLSTELGTSINTPEQLFEVVKYLRYR